LRANGELNTLLELQHPHEAGRGVGEHGQPLRFVVESSNSPLPLGDSHAAVSLPAKLKKLAKGYGGLGRIKATQASRARKVFDLDSDARIGREPGLQATRFRNPRLPGKRSKSRVAYERSRESLAEGQLLTDGDHI
jgi:hypothetical protein